MAVNLPVGVKFLMARLEKEGAQTYAVGEALCRLALGLPVQEYKLVTTAETVAVQALFEDGQVSGGKIIVPVDGGWCSITSTGTMPGQNTKDHIEKLMKKQPFTIYALAHNGRSLLASGATLEDLEKKVLRFSAGRKTSAVSAARDALELFAASAQLDIEPQGESLQTALRAAVSIKGLSPVLVRAELQRALLSLAPQRLQPLVSAGMLTFAGVGAGDLNGLENTPCTMLCRFWALLQRTKGSAYELCEALEYAPSFLGDLLWLQKTFAAPRPTNMDELKVVLKGGMPCGFEELNALFTASGENTGFDAQLFEKLERSGEAYAPHQLAVSEGMLAAAGVEAKNVKTVYNALFEAVFRSPALNHQQVLLKLAGELNAMVQ